MEKGREKEGARKCLAHNIYLPRNKSGERLFPFPLVFVALGLTLIDKMRLKLTRLGPMQSAASEVRDGHIPSYPTLSRPFMRPVGESQDTAARGPDTASSFGPTHCGMSENAQMMWKCWIGNELRAP